MWLLHLDSGQQEEGNEGHRTPSKYDEIYSQAMKTQHPNVHQYLNDILNILSSRISGDLMNTKDRHHIDFTSFNVDFPNVSTHVHFQTVVK